MPGSIHILRLTEFRFQEDSIQLYMYRFQFSVPSPSRCEMTSLEKREGVALNSEQTTPVFALSDTT